MPIFLGAAAQVAWLSGYRTRLRTEESWVRSSLPPHFSLDPYGRCSQWSMLPNTAVGRLGGRVVSVATLPVMVSRLGWGSWFKSDPRLNAAGSLIKPVRDPWNLAGWATPRQPRSHLEDTSTLPVSLTDLWRQHGGPGHTLSRKIWEVK